jgi:hypothetical protein
MCRPALFRLLSLTLFVPVFAAEELPKPELTEVWSPVPPVVIATAGAVPSDATVLLDGTSLDEWEPAKAEGKMWRLVEDGAMEVVSGKLTPEETAAATTGRKPDSLWDGLRTKREFADVQLHLEFRTPAEVKGAGQGRGNSGIFFMGLYELQVLDSYQNPTYVNGQLGSIYKQHPPLVNPARPPGMWQAYDVVFIAPRFDETGKLLSPARLTAFLNGVLVQHDSILRGPTLYRGQPHYMAHAPQLPLVLQDHGNPIAYRNIWVRALSLSASAL